MKGLAEPVDVERMRTLGRLISELADETEPNGDRAAGLRFVSELNKALTDLPRLLATGRDFLDSGDLGPAVTAKLSATWADLDRHRTELVETENLLAELQPALAELETVRTRHAELTTRLAEVRRLEALKDEVETLRAATSDLARREAALSDVRNAERELTEAGQAVGVRSALRLSELGTATRDTLERAERLTEQIASGEDRLAAQRGRVAALESDLETLRAEFAELQAIADQKLPHIEAHRGADRELCAALGISPLVKGSGLHHVQTALTEMEEQLRKADTAIRDALRASDTDHATTRKPTSLI
ncbi:hypothetical protein BZB76_1118 [Actinomadura pelletieri DSM 43383]|uniref:Uncharacterized protein n=1 Tax=Actinomadura pelletieri DSM 43383 TaxID=1120940 RepID=A0A495QZL4_9ACTN|nr:hypothetical protein [Actinomadura pelletieri]RKS79643.1 hypothetical protein BZB76_1118 [Actinomadura pelletieri DSM 43383]